MRRASASVVLSVAALFSSCLNTHIQPLGSGRYQVRFVTATLNTPPLRARDFSVGTYRFHGEFMTWPYEIRNDWAGFPINLFTSTIPYGNVMFVGYVTAKGGGPFPAREILRAKPTASLADALAAMLPRLFRCSRRRPESFLDMTGLKVACFAKRQEEQQALRARLLVGRAGMLVQVVTWTPGSKLSSWATAFWTSLRRGRRFGGRRPAAKAAVSTTTPPTLAALVRGSLAASGNL